MSQAPPAKGAPSAGSGGNSDSDDAGGREYMLIPLSDDNAQASEKVLGKRRARTPSGAASEPQEEESLSDADGVWEPEYEDDAMQLSVVAGGSAPKFARLTSEPEEEVPGQRASPQPGPSTTRGARGIKPVRRRTPRTRAAGKEGSPAELDALPYETPNFTCGWSPLQYPNSSPCHESCTRLSDLRRHQRPHFEVDLEYAKEHLNQGAIDTAQAALDKCAGRGQSYPCEVCGKVYSRLDAVTRHRQQPQGKRCNVDIGACPTSTIYKQRRAAEKRAKESQEAEEKAETAQTEEKDEGEGEEKGGEKGEEKDGGKDEEMDE
ncbi:hypothetical protein FRC10_004190 [Ceratobasidium sp. 414]|nr:hypothetical protein FRC10_004190 [Ceratobasidium sp. 414]